MAEDQLSYLRLLPKWTFTCPWPYHRKKKRMDSITYIWVADEDVRLECGLVQDMAQAEV